MTSLKNDRDDALVIGIDIGGTKTHLRAQLDERSWEHVLPSADWRKRSWSDDARTLVSQATALAGRRPIAALGVGAHGCDDADECAAFHDAISREFPGPVAVVNDAELMPLAVCKPHAVGLVAGTGSIAVHRDRNGQMRVAGGWGWIIGDEGSSMALMREAVRAVALVFDENGDRDDPLVVQIFEALSIPSAARIGSTFAAAARNGTAGAGAPAIFTAAEAGSPLAMRVIRQGGQALATLVHRLERRGANATHVVAGGAVIAAQSLLWDQFCNAVLELCKGSIQPILFRDKPVEGALRLAEGLLDPSRTSASLTHQK